ncbi:MAG: MdtA/MuxA family multidrug efflux RND transporter periplasmic adaptor subunit [Acidobacteria bacterium]|nr:MdtA/MuxA family multidrug efflux RND transporter periplasmic adaptor subunit [Acidobacteriota bacterium]MBV9147469.1 MdtA/MuxA family multidrug efflux RND transporter periplasmic adaptor subunit [Acidobacteriota bacterium]MBV9435109.1 MdtA/MuxA family multidrug efflux RND transporter periplasmic adaptor subunit [Acidobacteriota bacterium]
MPQPLITMPPEEREPELDNPPPRKSARRTVVWLVVALFVLALVVVGFRSHKADAGSSSPQGQGRGGGRHGNQGFDPNRPIPVSVAPAQEQDVPVYLEGLGNVQAYYTVTVHSRVDGELMKVNFREGQQVRQGEELALIDPRPYEVQMSQAEATKFKDQANLENARRDLQRYADLYKQGVIAQQQYQTQEALVAQNEGLVRSDDAQINNAKLNLTYCHIKAPIDGRVGLRLVDPGNIVHASDQNGLLVITQLQPIALLFTLPEDNLQLVAQHMKGSHLVVEAWSRDDTQKVATGSLETIDNQIDPNTGTFRLKGVFSNRDNALYPNQFINARLQVYTKKNAVTVPAAAIQNGAQGSYLYVVKQDQTVDSRQVKVAMTEGTLAVLDSGVNAGEQVVTDGQEKLQPGNKVEPQHNGRPGRVAPSDSAVGTGVGSGK